ncbi:MAG: MBOAT family protein [Rhizobiales bacterium]|nr:MBOAT family protein [Hyphomicrobiales bacterium]
MLFPTLDFGLFFSAVFLASWSLRTRLEPRKWLLLGASYVFYGWWDWRFLALIALSSALNHVAGTQIAASSDETFRKRIVFISVTLNLAILGVFKYYGFFLESLADLLVTVGLERDLPFMEIILPVGISFFTFQGISYVIDVYRRDVEPVRRPEDLFLYISFFPQLVAGPIVRASDFLPQINAAPRLDRKIVAFGFTLILLGLFKKMVLANYIATSFVDELYYDPSAFSALDLLTGAYAYAVQVYCDFSAYSDIAIGSAALLGYTFKSNFDRPLGSTSLQQLWQRWHISLGSFLRDYLYRNLRGRRGGGKWNIYRTTFLTMLIGGLWHGAAWTFIIWGAIHGAVLVLEQIVKSARKPLLLRWEAWRAPRLASAATPRAMRGVLELPGLAIAGWLVTFHVFALSAVFFRSPSLEVATGYFAAIASNEWTANLFTPFIAALVLLSVAAQFMARNITGEFAARLERLGAIGLGAFVGVSILVIYEVSPPGVAPFIYFQF